jgi:hypothetical protein
MRYFKVIQAYHWNNIRVEASIKAIPDVAITGNTHYIIGSSRLTNM